MEMSRITNADPIKRGSSYTSTQLNQQFTEVNAAFPMDGDNVRNEGIDQPVFDLNNGHGKSGIILVAADSNDNTTPVTASANTATTSPFDSPVTIQTWTLLQPVTTTDLIRVYWQFDYETVVNDLAPVNVQDNNGCVWAIWLEYQSSFGGSWEAVPNQGDFEQGIAGSPGSITSYGTHTSQGYGCTIVPHALVYHDSSTRVRTPNPSTGYGDWIYAPDSNIVIYGLRLRIRGLLDQKYDSVTGVAQNSWRLLTTSSGVQTNTVSRSYMAYLVMREQ
jgi:hypothetical protein|tara:strand:+ start:541 stop:1368 length:828 start_codon:yes stop_codon:yes gene_type:complete